MNRSNLQIPLSKRVRFSVSNVGLAFLFATILTVSGLRGDDTLSLRKAAREECDSGKAGNYLKDPDPEIRRYALYCLTENDPAKELAALSEAVKDPSPLVRLTAVSSLGRLAGKDPAADELLQFLYEDPDLRVRDAANRFSWPFHRKNVRLSEDPSWDYTVITEKSIPIPEDNWKLIADPANKGHRNNYFGEKFPDSAWEKGQCGEWTGKLANYPGYVWYRIRFTMPPKTECNAVEVRFQAVDESAWVWLNGVYLGAHDIGLSGWDKPFSLDCRNEIRFGEENLLVVRVLNREKAGGIWKPVFIDILK